MSDLLVHKRNKENGDDDDEYNDEDNDSEADEESTLIGFNDRVDDVDSSSGLTVNLIINEMNILYIEI